MAAETAGGQAASGGGPTPEDRGASREATARMLTYRLIPLWMFLVTFGITVAWEAGVRGNALTSEKLQAAALIALFVALFIGAPIGIRFFNPQPPKS